MTTASGLAPPVVSGTTPLPTSSSSGSSGSSLSSTTDATLAGNFQTFLTLLTTQLQNQNPLDPLDTNQFTQQLVQFASVEQQLKTNDQLTTLVSLQQTAQSTQALTFVGKTAVVDGGPDQWFGHLGAGCPDQCQRHHLDRQQHRPDRLHRQLRRINAGDNQPFTWNGRGNDGTQWPDGKYKLTATATDTAANSVAVSTQIQGVVDSVDLTQSPPLLSINGQNYTVNQIKSIAN